MSVTRFEAVKRVNTKGNEVIHRYKPKDSTKDPVENRIADICWLIATGCIDQNRDIITRITELQAGTMVGIVIAPPHNGSCIQMLVLGCDNGVTIAITPGANNRTKFLYGGEIQSFINTCTDHLDRSIAEQNEELMHSVAKHNEEIDKRIKDVDARLQLSKEVAELYSRKAAKRERTKKDIEGFKKAVDQVQSYKAQLEECRALKKQTPLTFYDYIVVRSYSYDKNELSKHLAI